MLTLEELKVAIVMMKRASCSGEESPAVATVINKLDRLYNEQAAAAQAEGTPSEAPEDKKDEGDKKQTRRKSKGQ